MANTIPSDPYYNPLDLVTGKTINYETINNISRAINFGIANVGTSPLWCQSWPNGLSFPRKDIGTGKMTRPVVLPYVSPRHTTYEFFVNGVNTDTVATTVYVSFGAYVGAVTFSAGSDQIARGEIDTSAQVATDPTDGYISFISGASTSTGSCFLDYTGGSFILKDFVIMPIPLTGSINGIALERGFEEVYAHPADPAYTLGMPDMSAGYPLSANYPVRARVTIDGLQRRRRVLMAWAAPAAGMIVTRPYGGFSYALTDSEDLVIVVDYDGSKETKTMAIGELVLELTSTGNSNTRKVYKWNAFDETETPIVIQKSNQDPFANSMSDYMPYKLVRPTVYSFKNYDVDNIGLPENTNGTNGDADIYSISVWGVER